MSRDGVVTQAEYRRVEVGARAAAVVVVLSLSAMTGSGRSHPLSLLLIAALAVVGSLPVWHRQMRRWRPVAEAGLAGLVIATTNPYDPALLPYLVVPGLSAGLAAGWTGAVTAAGASAVGMMMRGFLDVPNDDFSAYLVDAAQWSLLSLAVGLLASWIRRVNTQRSSDADSYAEASRLLLQLRDVARQLSGGLDAVSLAHAVLQRVHGEAPYERATVFLISPEGLPVLLAAEGARRGDWLPDIDDDLSPWAVAWRTVEPCRSDHGFTADPTLRGAVLPLRLDEHVVGLVGLERRVEPFTDVDLRRAQALLDEGSVRLDAALLFDELRGIATTEERRRLAREIHDGIAQELASMGYVVDDLSAQATAADQPDLAASIGGLRSELTRVITELRLSIFDLRSEVGAGLSLTAALSEYARTVGATSGLTVHLELAESPHRLRIETETELLRIAQEAMTNARKHAGAQNLWVTCHVTPPSAMLRIEDDGRGLAPGREDSYGLEIMQERAARIQADIGVGDRPGGGVVVEVRVNAGPREEQREDQRAARR